MPVIVGVLKYAFEHIRKLQHIVIMLYFIQTVQKVVDYQKILSCLLSYIQAVLHSLLLRKSRVGSIGPVLIEKPRNIVVGRVFELRFQSDGIVKRLQIGSGLIILLQHGQGHDKSGIMNRQGICLIDKFRVLPDYFVRLE